jgi:hypothetical protein
MTRFEKAESKSYVYPRQKVVFGPATLGPATMGPSFIRMFDIAAGEVAVCYLDPDPVHHQSHWAVGPVSAVVSWLLDESAGDTRRQALITVIGLRLLAAHANVPPDVMMNFEDTVVESIEPPAQS